MNPAFASLAVEPELNFTLVLVVKATLLIAAASTMALVLRRASAATRHLVWTLGLSGVLVLPLLSTVVPGWPVLLLPAPAEAPIPVSMWEERAAPATSGMQESVAVPAMLSETEGPPAAAANSQWDLPRISWTTGLLAAWMLGVVLVLARLALGWWGVRRLARRAELVDTPEWKALLHDLSWILDLNVPVRLLRSDRATMPMTWGTRKPVVLLPADADAWPAERRRVVLLHELAHVARRDCFTQGFANFACALYWFHPGVWYAARRLRVEREQACDDRVLAAGTRAAEYASHLLEVARRFRSVGIASAAAVAMARPSQLEGRLLAVLDPVRNRCEMRRRARVCAAISALALVVPLAAMQAVVRAPVAEGSDAGAFYPNGPTPDLSVGQRPSRVAPADQQEQVIQRRFAARPGQMLRFDLGTGGDIRVRGWDRDKISVRAELGGRDWRDTRVEFVEYPDGLEIGSRHVGTRLNASTSHRFEVYVPHRFNVDVRSAGGGVAITEVHGNFTGETKGGALSLTQVRGEARLATGGGPITIFDSHLDGEVRTGGGSVGAHNNTGDVRVRSGSGGMAHGSSLLNIRSADSSPLGSEVVRIHRESGDITVPRAPAGAEVFTAGGAIVIGNSGGPVRAQTGGGAIQVRSARDLVKLGSGGGAITVDAVDGEVGVSTGAGAVVVTMVGDPRRGDRNVEIRSGSGAVVLTLPDGIDATFDIEAAYKGTDNNGRTGPPVQITSDFPLEQTEYREVQGSAYRVRATGRAGDGRNRIFIRTVGDVRIRRASGRTSSSAQGTSRVQAGSGTVRGSAGIAQGAGFAYATGENTTDRRRTVKALAQDAPPAAALAALTRIAWEDHEPEVRREAVELLAELPNDLGLKEMMLIAQRHATEEVRREAVERLGIKGCDDAITTLLSVIEGDPDTGVQREAVRALAETYPRRRARQGEIRGMLERIAESHPNSAVRARALRELEQLASSG